MQTKHGMQDLQSSQRARACMHWILDLSSHSAHCLHTGLHSNTTAFSCYLLPIRLSRHKLSTVLPSCKRRSAIMARKKNASRKAAKPRAAHNTSKASPAPIVAIQSLPKDLLSRILFLTGQPAAFATVCRCHGICTGREGSCTCSAVQ
jgi:hypothetical protein